MAYATVAEMALLRPDGIDSDQEPRAEALLEEASTLAEEAAGREWVLPDTPPKSVKSVVIQVALRVFDNPSDFSAEQVGPASYQRPQDRVTGMALSKGEEKRVKAAVGKCGAGSTRAPLSYDSTNLATTTALGEDIGDGW
jgi:hypothetical protein